MTSFFLSEALQQSQTRHLEDLIEWLKIPSVSSDTSKIGEVKQAAKWIADKLKDAGLSVETIPTQGHALVYAETPEVANGPTVLVYGHYDVQPAEPLELWTSGAFEPTIRDGNLYARGATDDKGQVLTHVQSVCEWLASGKPLPLQIKFLIEGEEEVGSANLERMLPELADKLACDCVVISDSSQYADGQPAITYGLRGIATYELKVQGPSKDLHSGSFGGAVMNPAIALCHLMSSMVDDQGRIQIRGFYDDVRELSAEERAAWKQLSPNDDEFARSAGAKELFGEKGYTADERRWARPTFDINGLTSGHQGEGVKTVLPAHASAKFSFRLVPDQDPQTITSALRSHLEANLPKGVTMDLKPDHGAPGMLADTESVYMDAAKAAIESAFGKPPVLIREGGSIPIVTKFQETLKCDCLLLGWGLSDDNAHSPDEKFRIDDYYRGIAASAVLWEAMGTLQPVDPFAEGAELPSKLW
ncbi:Succinyl-diaminopimelate desuccinylase [Rubripirellula amarantea]|uniref:Succinyl-diaminopimelate desuccinylase n=1 Tax=Rubripirellula amarantea TaxID=2527999 RepID=A0A5C5WNE9_9BACT|nr:dipeptidase [Rubripirellula amarantea]TWT51352.1 Succinyl-diaminopimelate desuccinylase [Rubripirellula amarantea]